MQLNSTIVYAVFAYGCLLPYDTDVALTFTYTATAVSLNVSFNIEKDAVLSQPSRISFPCLKGADEVSSLVGFTVRFHLWRRL